MDLVTETDAAVEQHIRSALAAAHPGIGFLGEESSTTGLLAAAPTFVVDPVDGTTNFVHGHPYVAVSLALCVRRAPAVAVVYNPYAPVLYSAVAGRGAWRDGSTRLPLPGPGRSAADSDSHTAPPPPPLGGLARCLVATEWGSDRTGNDFDVKARTFAALAGGDGGAMCHSIRSLGSAALNLCAVAAGTLDVYWEAGCWVWDVAAGWLILREAGGLVADANPGNWRPRLDGRRYLAVRAGDGQRAVVDEFWSHVQGRLEVGLDAKDGDGNDTAS